MSRCTKKIIQELDFWGHVQGFVEAGRVRFLPEDELLPFEAFDAVNGPARYENLGVAGVHNGRFPVESHFDSTLDHTEILLMILKGIGCV